MIKEPANHRFFFIVHSLFKITDMVQASTLKFLSQLQKNNNKPWFDKNRPAYENAKSDFLSMVDKLIPAIASFDSTIAGLEARNCVFRINRDVRFSKDKKPYKHNMAAYFNKDGKKGLGAGYYLHIEPGKSFAAAGIWMPEPAVLAKIRQEIDYNLNDWNKILKQAAFRKNFEKGLDTSEILSRPPKGYTEDNPALEFLKLKCFVVMHVISDKDITEKNFVKKVAAVFQSAKPLISFLNTAVD